VSSTVHSISGNPRLRISRLVELLTIRQRLAALDTVREHLPLTDPDRHDLDRTDTAFGNLPLDTHNQKTVHQQRRTALLRAIREQGGRWKSGRVIRLYRRLGYGPVGRHSAVADLKKLRAAGHLIQHDEEGVRFFTLDPAGGAR